MILKDHVVQIHMDRVQWQLWKVCRENCVCLVKPIHQTT